VRANSGRINGKKEDMCRHDNLKIGFCKEEQVEEQRKELKK
jgi:hypothetical protein